MKAGEHLQSHLRFDHVKTLLQVEELHALLRPHLLRRMKADVLQALPPKKEQIVRVELSGPQRTLYKALLTNSYPTLIGGAHRCFIPRVSQSCRFLWNVVPAVQTENLHWWCLLLPRVAAAVAESIAAWVGYACEH